ncbi:MAG TPA: hypothetical protein VFH77_02135 [Streptomyces sp.]|nr:hypothetical protein [Streptomyces sp.]
MPSFSPNPSGSITPDSLSPAREAEIRERAAAATAGPWGTYYENPQSDGVRLIDIAADLQDTGHGYRCRRYIAQTESGQIDNDPAHRDWDADQDNDQSAADAEFIAHAREDVPVLLAEIERLRGELEDRDRTIRYFDEQSKRRKAELQAAAAKCPTCGGGAEVHRNRGLFCHQEEEAPTPCTAEYGGPGYTRCELEAGHAGEHESAMGHLRRATWGGAL